MWKFIKDIKYRFNKVFEKFIKDIKYRFNKAFEKNLINLIIFFIGISFIGVIFFSVI